MKLKEFEKEINNGTFKWFEDLLENFGCEIGSSLEKLKQEYDDMIDDFEQETRQSQLSTSNELRSIEIQETNYLEPSTNPDLIKLDITTSNKDKKRKKLSIRRTKISLRRKLSMKTVSCPPVKLDRSDSIDSASSDLYEICQNNQNL